MPEGARPLVGGRSGTFLQMLTGCDTLRDYVKHFVTLNLLDYFPGKRGRGDFFPMTEARHCADQLTPHLKGRNVVFVGKQVAEAFDAISPVYFEWRRYPTFGPGGFQGAPIPHPSGINRFWNDPSNVALARSFFDRLKRG